MVWAVSQAAPLRRVIVDGVLNLYQCALPCVVIVWHFPAD
jgi:hypothetical protein